MKKLKKLFTFLMCCVFVGIPCSGDMYYSWPANPEQITRSEMIPIDLKLVYTGKKPAKIGSVQSLAITDKYFVIAARPCGTALMGGETNNKIIIIDRASLEDVTNNFKHATGVYELGHANGMTYNNQTNELLVVGVRNENGVCRGVVHIDADTFRCKETEFLEVDATGIAYVDEGKLYVRAHGEINLLDDNLSPIDCFNYQSGLTSQDIAYHDGAIYLADWARSSDFEVRTQLELATNQNVIYRIDEESKEIVAFLIDKPRNELESLDFIDGDAYILMNGIGKDKANFYIYRVSNDVF